LAVPLLLFAVGGEAEGLSLIDFEAAELFVEEFFKERLCRFEFPPFAGVLLTFVVAVLLM
jgi:hypothetical protein